VGHCCNREFHGFNSRPQGAGTTKPVHPNKKRCNGLYRFSHKLKSEALRAALKTLPAKAELPENEKSLFCGISFQ